MWSGDPWVALVALPLNNREPLSLQRVICFIIEHNPLNVNIFLRDPDCRIGLERDRLKEKATRITNALNGESCPESEWQR